MDGFDLCIQNLLVSLLFFGLAGGISTKGQWTWNVTMFMIFLTATIAVMACISEMFDPLVGFALLLFSLILAALTSTKKAKACMN